MSNTEGKINTLGELINDNTDTNVLTTAAPVDEVIKVTEDDIREELGVPVPEEEEAKGMMHDIVDLVNTKTEKLNKEANEIIDSVELEKDIQDMEDSETDDIVVELDEEEEDVEEDTVEDEKSNISDLLEDLDLDDDDEDSEDIQNSIKKSLNGKIKPLNNKIDLATFTVANKAVSVFDAFKNSSFDSAVNKIDWFLPSSGILLTFKPFKAVDIVNLNPQSSNQNTLNTYRSIYKLIYEHIINDDKPPFEEFIKLIKFDDIPHIYYAIYKSAFDGVNTIPYQCTNKKCENIFADDNVSMDEIVKYKDEEYEKEYKHELETHDSLFTIKEYDAIRTQVSDDFVVELRKPSVFNVIFENLYLSENFREKYSDIISLISYIENIYYINRTDNSLSPIKVKVDKKDFAKSVKYRIANYSKIIQSLSSDQYFNLFSVINGLSANEDITYVQPQRTCPKCGTVIEEIEQSPEAMLFSRHQLGAITNS